MGAKAPSAPHPSLLGQQPTATVTDPPPANSPIMAGSKNPEPKKNLNTENYSNKAFQLMNPPVKYSILSKYEYEWRSIIGAILFPI